MVKHMTRNILEEVKRELNLICGSDSDKYPVHILWRQNHCSICTGEGTLQEVFSECTVWWKLLIVVLSVEFGWGLFCFLLTLSNTKSIAALPCEVEGAVMLSTVNVVPITKCVGELSVTIIVKQIHSILILTKDSAYTDGLSLAHGTPRNHIWPFTADNQGLLLSHKQPSLCPPLMVFIHLALWEMITSVSQITLGSLNSELPGWFWDPR